MERRLAAILAADMVGYSRLMAADEAGTIARQKAHRTALIDPKIAQYGGRIFKTTGDGMFVEFPSVVDALHCAVELQSAMMQREAQVADDKRIQYRIGINLGDIVIDGEDILGDGVNVAARMETLAAPGGICVSRPVHTQVAGKVDVLFEDLGEQAVKNMPNPIQVFRVILDASATQRQATAATAAKRALSWPVAAGGLAVLVIVAGTALWQRPWKAEFEPASVEEMAFPLPDKPSIAVLPFNNYSGDEQLDFFADGLTENITSALAKISGIFVIARNSAATYSGKPVNIKQVAEELGVQYVLEGSVQKSGDRLRITAQLVDAIKGHHLWTDRFDRQAEDLFAVQDEITKQVFTELQVELTEGEHARIAGGGTDNLDAWLLRVEAYSEYIKFTRESMIRSQELYQAAHEADPNWAWPLAGISDVHWYEARRGWSKSRERSFRLGIEYAERAITLQPDEFIGYLSLGNMMYMIGDTEKGAALRSKAIELAPSSFVAHAGFAIRLSESDREHEAIEMFERAIRLSPKHPWWIEFGYGFALHLAGRHEEAIRTYKKAIEAGAMSVPLRIRLAAVYADMGQMDEAKAAIEDALHLNRNFTVSKYLESYPYPGGERQAWYRNLLIRASLPE